MLNVRQIKSIHDAQVASLKNLAGSIEGLSIDLIADNIVAVKFQGDPLFILHSDVNHSGSVVVEFKEVEKYKSFDLPSPFEYNLLDGSSTNEEREQGFLAVMLGVFGDFGIL